MDNVYIINLKKYSDKIEYSSGAIIDRWLKNSSVAKILVKHGIDIDFFNKKFAANVLHYFVGIIQESEKIGSCPVMIEMLEFFQEKNITSSELFTICIHFRESVIKQSIISGFFNEDVYDEIEHIFNANFKGVLEIYTDTIHKARKDLEEFYAIVENSFNEIYIFDQNTLKFTYANLAARENIGYSLEALQNMTPCDIKPKYNTNSFVKLLSPLINNEEKVININTQHKRANGTIYEVETKLQQMKIGGQKQYVAFIHDVTSESNLQRLNRAYKALSNANLKLSRADNEQDLLNDICNTIQKDCQYKLVWIGFKKDNEDKEVEPVAYAGVNDGYLDNVDIVYADTPRGRGPTGLSIQQQRPVVINNTQNDETFSPWRDEAKTKGFLSCAAFPIKSHDEVYGSITVYSNEINSFTNDEVKLLSQLSSNLAMGLEALRNKQLFETIFNLSRDGIAIVDMQTNFLYFNDVYLEMTGFSKEELLTKSCIGLSDPKNFEKAKKSILKVKEKGYVDNIEKLCFVKDGKKIMVNMSIVLMPDKQHMLISARDITHIRQEQQKMRKYVSLIDEHIATSTTDLDGNITYVSKAFSNMTGYDKLELIGKNHKLLRDPLYEDSFFDQMWSTLSNNKIWRGEIKNRKKDGSIFWIKAILAPLYDQNDKKIGYSAIDEDITDKKRIEEISITDGLTDVFNRRHFNEIFPKVINSAKRKNDLVSFLIMDVDHFKQYNDVYGHQMGDEVLIKVANSMKQSLKRADDYCFRLGGEEFGIIFKADSQDKAKEFADSIRNGIENLKIEHKGNSAIEYISVSIGLISKRAEDIEDSKQIYKEADALLYKAKASGRNQVVY